MASQVEVTVISQVDRGSFGNENFHDDTQLAVSG